MCYELFLASDQPLPLVTWSPGAVFGVADLPDRPPLPAEMNAAHLYDVGSQTQCACGFDRWTSDAYGPDYERQTEEAFSALAEYLSHAVTLGSMLRLYYVWYGEGELPIEHRSSIQPDQLLDPAFKIENRHLIEIAAK